MRTKLARLSGKLELPGALMDLGSVMTAVVVDDETPARDLLKLLLQKEESVVIVAECKDGTEAIDAIEMHEPDVVFIDVEMPSLSGVSVAKHYAHQANSPYFVFVTAYDQFAVEAFELNAVDYLVKPLSKDRMSAAVARARLAIRRDSALSLTGKILELASSTDLDGNSVSDEPRVMLKKHDTIRSVAFDEIVWVEAANQYVRIHTSDDEFIMSQPLGRFADRLADDRFVRIHRSAVINGHHIERVERRRNGAHAIHLVNGVELPLARSRATVLKSLLRFVERNRGSTQKSN